MKLPRIITRTGQSNLPGITSMAMSLRDEYVHNPVRFRLQWQGSVIKARGKVHAIAADESVILLKSNWLALTVRAAYCDPEYVAGLSPKQRVSLRGTVGSVRKGIRYSGYDAPHWHWTVVLEQCKPLP